MNEVIRNYEEKLSNILKIKESIKDIHPSVNKLYPIAIVEEESFLIFDCISDSPNYKFIKIEPTKLPIPKGVRAAFDLEGYDNKIAAVVTGEIFDSLDGYAVIFHEFAHCFQYNTCEFKLKSQLSIAQEYYEKEDYMWEITHPFPYDDIKVKRSFHKYIKGLNSGDLANVMKTRKEFINILDKGNAEYFIWQEWKEGLARFIEDKIRVKLGLKVDRIIDIKTLNRVSFYEAGSRYIKLLEQNHLFLTNDIEELFYHMNAEIY